MDKMKRRFPLMNGMLALCLCLMLLCSGAAAESGADSVNLGAEGCDQMKFVCTLPDGRLVFSGSRGTIGNYNESRARLLCLNPDFSASWEYWDPAGGMARYTWGALLEDGNIGVIYVNVPYQEVNAVEIRKFTPEGEPVGEAVDLLSKSDEDATPDDVNPLGFFLSMTGPDGRYMRGFLDWDGNLLFGFQKGQGIGVNDVVAEEDGLILAGKEPFSQGCAKIMKVDLQGNPLWETVLPLMTSFGQEARMQKCVRMSDGGYAAWVWETGPNVQTGNAKRASALVRLNADGRVLWINQEGFADDEQFFCQDLIEYDGKIVLLKRNDMDVSEKTPRTYLWFDADGKKLGKTELQIPRADIGAMTDWEEIQIYSGEMLVTDSGLWSLYSLRIVDDKDIRKEMDTVDDILYRVPEL